MKLSVALATYNEEENITRCLDAVSGIADEIIIVDGSSTDQTVEIARKLNAKILVKDNPPIFHINKQKAAEMCSGDWILHMDADEVVSSELADEIKIITGMSQGEINNRELKSPDTKLFYRHQQLLEQRDGKYGLTEGDIVAFFIPRKNLFFGKYLRYGGVYPDGVIRLTKNNKAEWPCKSVHEQMKIDGRVSWLENSLLHYDSPTLNRYMLRAGRYINLKVNEFKENKVQINLRNSLYFIIYKPLEVFLIMTIRHKGILDGWQGVTFALFSALHFPIAYIKYWRIK